MLIIQIDTKTLHQFNNIKLSFFTSHMKRKVGSKIPSFWMNWILISFSMGFVMIFVFEFQTRRHEWLGSFCCLCTQYRLMLIFFSSRLFCQRPIFTHLTLLAAPAGKKAEKCPDKKKWSHPSTLMMTRTASEVVKFIPKVQKSRRIVMAIPNRLCGVHFYVRCRNAIACDAKQRWKEKAVVQETK